MNEQLNQRTNEEHSEINKVVKKIKIKHRQS